MLFVLGAFRENHEVVNACCNPIPRHLPDRFVPCEVAMLAEGQQNRFLNPASHTCSNGKNRPFIEQFDHKLAANVE